MSSSLQEQIASGYQARRGGRLADAQRLFAASITAASELPDQSLLAKALTGAGQIERDMRNHAAAVGYYNRAADIYRGRADPLRLAHTIRHIADILLDQGSIDQARPRYEEALGLYRQHLGTPPLDLANALRGYALLREQAGERGQAKALWLEARSLYESVGVQPGVDESSFRISRLSAAAP